MLSGAFFYATPLSRNGGKKESVVTQTAQPTPQPTASQVSPQSSPETKVSLSYVEIISLQADCQENHR